MMRALGVRVMSVCLLGASAVSFAQPAGDTIAQAKAKYLEGKKVCRLGQFSDAIAAWKRVYERFRPRMEHICFSNQWSSKHNRSLLNFGHYLWSATRAWSSPQGHHANRTDMVPSDPSIERPVFQ
jgi:hypothetical protein